MLGLNSLLKLFRKTFAPKVEGRGFLPRRYYLHRALEALDEDDIDEAVRMITLAGQDKKKSARWRMVCQQVIFRCRVLVSIHEKQMDQINTELEIFGKTEDLRTLYLRLQEVERKARDILKNYELRLLEQLSESTASVAQPS
ncbi:MAG: hypothetical protein OEU80_17035 [Deltaproteobacteria bacterium]|jgi:hypothetical protein|nr:hypothetical protein [Deltaproteobacteria bacterium]MDH3897625.1 hypothetical protein [Deltaproteobacteria bacterium]MDH3926825.1 hypothetical protein [Deltaproteobacteria bacterium]MDH3963542.1 hypothetical protein [Deltaproteobacteria bacterium]